MKKISKQREKEVDEILAEDDEKWDDRKLGGNSKFVEPAPDYAKRRASVVTTIRMNPTMVRNLKELAQKEGIPYQTVIKSVLTKYIQDKKRA
jgi:predicted DNA binding CopG/RHH family protein